MERQYKDRTETVITKFSGDENFGEKNYSKNKRIDESYEKLAKLLGAWEENASKVEELQAKLKSGFETVSQKNAAIKSKLTCISEQISQIQKQNSEILNEISGTAQFTERWCNYVKDIKFRVDLGLYALAFYFICIFVISPLANRFNQFFWAENKTAETKAKSENTNQKIANLQTANFNLQNQPVKTK